MAVSYLGLTEQAFWEESPRRLLMLIEQWKRIQRTLLGIKDPEEEDPEGRTAQEQVMWDAWDRM